MRVAVREVVACLSVAAQMERVSTTGSTCCTSCSSSEQRADPLQSYLKTRSLCSQKVKLRFSSVEMMLPSLEGAPLSTGDCRGVMKADLYLSGG